MAALTAGAGSGADGAAGSPARIFLTRDQKPLCAGAAAAAGLAAEGAATGAEVAGRSGATAGGSGGGLRSCVPGSVTSGAVGMR